MNIDHKFVFLLLCFAASPLQAAIVFEQLWDGSGNALSSQNEEGVGSVSKVYDNFSLNATTSLTGLTWYGAYFNGAQAPIANFLIELWSDSAGPNGSLVSETVPGSANENFVISTLDGDVFRYEANFSAAFVAQAGMTYWLSIQPTIVNPPQWGWSSAVGGEGLAYQEFLGERSEAANDLAFSLSAAPVPLPASFLLLGSGLVGLIGGSLRRS